MKVVYSGILSYIYIVQLVHSTIHQFFMVHFDICYKHLIRKRKLIFKTFFKIQKEKEDMIGLHCGLKRPGQKLRKRKIKKKTCNVNATRFNLGPL